MGVQDEDQRNYVRSSVQISSGLEALKAEEKAGRSLEKRINAYCASPTTALTVGAQS